MLLFTGRAEITIDAKQRLAVPSKYRNMMGEEETSWYCMPWPDEMHLRLYPKRTFEMLANGLQDSLGGGGDASEIDRSFSYAELLEMDKSGRVRLSKWHLDLVELPTDVMVIGSRNRLEVHSRDAWLKNDLDRFRKMAARYERAERARTPA